MKCVNFERRSSVQKPDQKEHLMKFWRDSAIAVAGASNSTKKEQPGLWATQMLDDYCKLLLALEKQK